MTTKRTLVEQEAEKLLQAEIDSVICGGQGLEHLTPSAWSIAQVSKGIRRGVEMALECMKTAKVTRDEALAKNWAGSEWVLLYQDPVRLLSDILTAPEGKEGK